MGYTDAPAGWWRTFVLETPARTAKLAVVRADGAPHVAPVWVDVDKDQIIFMTAANTIKGKAILRDPRVSLCWDDQRPPFSFLTIAGTATTSVDPDELLEWANQDRRPVHGRRPGRRVRPAELRAARNAGPGHADQDRRQGRHRGLGPLRRTRSRRAGDAACAATFVASCYNRRMAEIPARDLRNHTAEVLRRVEAGEEIDVLRDNRPVAKIIPLSRRPRWLPASEVARELARLGPIRPAWPMSSGIALTETTDDVPW